MTLACKTKSKNPDVQRTTHFQIYTSIMSIIFCWHLQARNNDSTGLLYSPSPVLHLAQRLFQTTTSWHEWMVRHGETFIEWWTVNVESTRVWCHQRHECWCGASGDGMIWGPYRLCAPRFLLVEKDPLPWSKEVEEVVLCLVFAGIDMFDPGLHFCLENQAILQLLGIFVVWLLVEGNAVIRRAGEIRRSKSLAGWGESRKRFMRAKPFQKVLLIRVMPLLSTTRLSSQPHLKKVFWRSSSLSKAPTTAPFHTSSTGSANQAGHSLPVRVSKSWSTGNDTCKTYHYIPQMNG